MTTLVWFRQDLRVADNPALAFAAGRGPVVPVYILDETPGVRAMGGASRWWLHHSLAALNRDLRRAGAAARRCRGDAAGACGAYRRDECGLEPLLRAVCDRARHCGEGVADGSRDRGRSFNGSLLLEPWEVKTRQGGPFKVFSPFWRACLGMRRSAAVAGADACVRDQQADLGDRLEDWALLPAGPNWAVASRPNGHREKWVREARSSCFWIAVSRDTGSCATGPTCRRSRGCRRICISARFRRGKS